MSTEKRMVFFAVAAVIGVIVTWYFNIQHMLAVDGSSAMSFIEAMYANSASTSISNDLLVVVATFLFWSYTEAKRLGMRHWWVYIILTFVIAIAFAFPLFMYMREKAIAQSPVA